MKISRKGHVFKFLGSFKIMEVGMALAFVALPISPRYAESRELELD